ncbi:MAG: hypothetical protein JOY71_11230 [Acetobacteraceae bacterium]|nr:hypothetical protein [Acetobacteraceae bacterium]MBV8522676.1 hypothetical protein [Acetobacteraceae bacterium]MBV8588651.1 hypothetical protein [Acetobacteraceae bacterium]
MKDKVIASKIGLRRHYGRKIFLATSMVGALACGPSVHAQINPFRGYRGPTLTREDLDAGSAAARKLLNREPASVGDTESWTAPNTGNRGTFTIQRVFERSGMPCRALASEVVHKRPQTKRDFTLTYCRIASGEWRLSH